MDRRFIGRAIFLRHGQTDYTDIFPDLTDEGKKTIANSAATLKNIVGYQNLILVSSPSVRARGSMSIIARKLEYRDEIKIDNRISAVAQHNKEIAMAIFNEHKSQGGILSADSAYSSDSRYEDERIFELRSRVKKRFYDYLSSLSRSLLIYSDTPCIINVSHYELLYHFVESIFKLDYKKDKTLGHGEIINVSFYDVGINDIVEMETVFRDKTVSGVFFNYKEGEIHT